jgi:hypothetical protein
MLAKRHFFGSTLFDEHITLVATSSFSDLARTSPFPSAKIDPLTEKLRNKIAVSHSSAALFSRTTWFTRMIVEGDTCVIIMTLSA